jgi:hypothetical protein
MSQGTWNTDQVWDALTELLNSQLDNVDCANITDRDFSEDGELILNPPSVRTFFEGENAAATSDSQRLSYLVDGKFTVLVVDQDYRGITEQARATLQLVNKVKSVLIGARLLLPTGETSEPVQWYATAPQPLEGMGVAYAAGFIVPGLAQFQGPNANPLGGN